MTSKYHKGRYYEYKIRDILKRMGWFVARMAKSGPCDLIAIRGNDAIAFEIKKNGPKKVPEKFLRLVESYGMKGIYITIIGNLYYWKPINLDVNLIEEFKLAFGPNVI